MELDNILDHWTNEEDEHRMPKLNKGEEVLWHKRPKIPALIEHPDWDRSRNQRLLYILGVLSIPILVWLLGQWAGTGTISNLFLCLMALCLLLVFKPPHFFFHRFLKYNKTNYRVTNQRITLYIDYGYTKQEHELLWENVRDLRYTPFRERMGTIHFVTKMEVNFTTYSFEDKEERQFPTLELVENGEQVFRLLKNFQKRSANSLR